MGTTSVTKSPDVRRTNAQAVPPLAVVVVAVAALLGVVAPAASVTGGQEVTNDQFPYVGMVVFYQPDGRFRCSGTLIAPRVFLTAAHCAFQDIGKVAVTFDPLISRTADESEIDIPRAADDSGPDDAISTIGFTPADITPPKYQGEQTWVLGTPYTHPDYSDFTDLKNWNDTGVVILDTAVALPTRAARTRELPRPRSRSSSPRRSSLRSGTAPRSAKPMKGRGKPVPESTTDRPSLHDRDPDRRSPTQIFQTNGNVNDPGAAAARASATPAVRSC